MAQLIVHNPPTVKLKASGYTGTPTGDIELSENNRTYNVSPFATATTAIPEEEKTVTPSTVEQTVTPDNGLLKKVTVEPTPLESKTVTPSTEQQTILPQSPAIGFSQFTVEPMPAPPVLIEKTITENGVYKAEDDNVDGFDEVTVNVGNTLLNALIDGSTSNLISEVTTIRASLASGNSWLESLSFPYAVSVGLGAFYGCSNIKSIYFPVAASFGAGAFRACKKLVNVDFPLLENIGMSCFYDCPSLITLILHKRALLSNDLAIPSQTIVYVENSDLEWYSTATNWSAIYAGGRVKSIDELPPTGGST